MDKIAEALGPWPILQLFFGTAVLGVGVFAVMRGLANAKPSERMNWDDARQEWEAYQQLASIERHTEAIAENQKVMLDRVNQCTEAIKQLSEAIKALTSVMWNREQR